ncbi:hypothetical protein NQZ68_021120 [Dissostichus eleginoides]|nr:hypothetical protein NQZ68_021120 [Dissostichus eleginoides]
MAPEDKLRVKWMGFDFIGSNRQKAFKQEQNAALFLQLLPWPCGKIQILHWLEDPSQPFIDTITQGT